MGCTKIRILMIDDEAYLHKVVHLMVVSMGYDCVCAKSCQEALDVIASAMHSKDPFSVGIVDLTIRGESGGLDVMRKVAPYLPLIVTSGYTVHDVMLAPEHYGFAAALPKPFLKGELKAMLSAVLETRRCRGADQSSLRGTMDIIRQRDLSKIQNAMTSIYNHEIVIVDDNPFGTFTLEMILQTEGFQNLKIFNDPTAVLQYAKESSRPALIITDFQMPNLNGIELIQELDRFFPGIDGIIVTGAPEIARQCSSRFPVLEKDDSVKEELLRLVWNIIGKGIYREDKTQLSHSKGFSIGHDKLRDLINESSHLENTVARLYLLLSGIFKEEQSFWLNLYIEEKLHATIFDIFTRNEIPLDDFPINMIDMDIASIKRNIRKSKRRLIPSKRFVHLLRRPANWHSK